MCVLLCLICNSLLSNSFLKASYGATKNYEILHFKEFEKIKDSTCLIESTIYFHKNKSKLNAFSTFSPIKNSFQSQMETTIGYSSWAKTSISLVFINGFKLNRKIYLGFGLGGTIHTNFSPSYNNHKSYPLFLRTSYDFFINKSTPYLFGDLGTQIENNYMQNTIRPLNFRIGLGNKHQFKKYIGYLALSYNYKNQRNLSFSWNPVSGMHDLHYTKWSNAHFVEIGIGMQFN